LEIIPGIEAIPEDIGASVVTIGMFDGLHLGHRRIIHIAHEKARDRGIRCVVFTFDRHPLEIIAPGNHPKLLSSSAQKLRLLEEMDVDMVLMAHLDEGFSRIPAENFVDDLLVRRLGAVCVVLGENFRFGKDGRGNVAFLKKVAGRYGLEVEAVPLLRFDGEIISSTLIRTMIEKGKVEEASRRLGWDYMIEGVVVRGDARGRKLGFPTANLEVHDNRCIPARGVYSGQAHLEERVLPAVTYIGEVPTFPHPGMKRQRIEVHIPGWEEELYDRFLGVSFKKRLRKEIAFTSSDELARQIKEDVERALRES
jgi:riboflavin kinase/FMN adenylyltransferase